MVLNKDIVDAADKQLVDTTKTAEEYLDIAGGSSQGKAEQNDLIVAEEKAIKNAVIASEASERACSARTKSRPNSHKQNNPIESNSNGENEVPTRSRLKSATNSTKLVPPKSSHSPRKSITTTSANNTKDGSNTNANNSTSTTKSRVLLPHYMEPLYYIGGGNGVAIIEDVLSGLGWKRTKDKEDNYKLKWCELKSQINYHAFKEGDQIVNHIPNCNLLTNKLGLLTSLQDYDRMSQAMRRRTAKLDFLPETFKLDDPREREVFRQTFSDGDIFICKPTGRNQGKGIFLVKTQEEVNKVFEEQESRTKDGKPVKPLNRIIQRYIHNPLLLNKKKFDIRCYMLVASTIPYLVVFHKGYVRLSIHDYSVDSDNLIAHLTNQFIQKKDPTYKDVKDETTWSMEKFNDYINDNFAQEKGIEKDWAFGTLTNRMKQIMTYCFNAVKNKLACKIGYFDLYGFDFMVDENMKVWLIEVNVNPCLATNCEALKEVIPGCVKETIHLAVECFEKSRKGKPLMPLHSLENFEILVNACPQSASTKGQVRSKSTSPSMPFSTRQSHNSKMTKEPAVVSASTDVTQVPVNKTKTTMTSSGKASSPSAPATGEENMSATAPNTANKSKNIQSQRKKFLLQSTSQTDVSDSMKNKNTAASNQVPSKVLVNKYNTTLAPAQIKMTTFQLPEEANTGVNKSLITQQHKFGASKETSKTNVSEVMKSSRNSDLKSSSEISQYQQQLQKPKTKNFSNRKTPFGSIKHEPTFSVKVIATNDTLTTTPAETKIVIVENKTNTEIVGTQNSRITNKTNFGVGKSNNFLESSLKNQNKKTFEPDNTISENVKTNKSAGNERTSASLLAVQPKRSNSRSPIAVENKPQIQHYNRRKSAGNHRRKENTSPYVEALDSNVIDINSISKPLYRVGNTYTSTTGMMLPVTGITPTDPTESDKVRMSRYTTVFPISPYSEPVAQLKMTHRPVKKSKSRMSYENRGS